VRRAQVILAVLMVVLSNVLVAAVCITITVQGQREASRLEAQARALAAQQEAAARIRQQRESDLRWCPIVLALVPQPGDPKPSTGRGQVIADSFAKLAADFDCTPAGPVPRPSFGRNIPR
jgi:hypothetical protein